MTTEQARLDLVTAAAGLAAVGLSPGQSGNISVRVGDKFLMSPTNSSLATLNPEELAVIQADGTHVDGPRPSKEVLLHFALYRRNPDNTAVVHLHSPHAVALSCREPWSAHCAIPPITPYLFLRVGQVPLIPYAAPGDPLLAAAIDSNPYEFRAALLANHGLVAAGSTLEAAVNAAMEIEETARVTLLLGEGNRTLLQEQDILALTAGAGTPWRTTRALAAA